ncbi:MAG: serine/threonine protein kinase, partial [Planctomycetales bacterium]|nr:serine/threonine protein kinase [Planctomycetales bacterium]
KLAVKLLRTDRHLPCNLEDFKREAQIIGRLNHPGIVSILGWGETFDGRPFYTMPFVDRGNLLASAARYHEQNRTRIKDSDHEFRDLIYRLASVCKTIAYAHSRSIVHRDLKPENIMLGKYGETLVIDWGCATRVNRHERFKMAGEQTLHLKGVNDSTSSGGMTLRYASPEQLHGGKTVGPESDIYSLGAILYRLLTGKSPLEDTPSDQVRNLVMSGSLPAVETLKGGIPKPLMAICQKAMALAPEDRYETALAMAEDLESYLSDDRVSVCRDSTATRMVRFVRRNRTASAIVLGTLLLGSALLSIALAGQSVSARQAKASANERLRLAATMAANIGGFEVDRRINLLEYEAQNAQLVSVLAAIELSPQDRQLWDKAQSLLYEFKDEVVASGVELESMFLNDSRGTQVARAPKTDTIGENFAYRNYFHGLAEDLDTTSAEYLRNPPKPAARPVVSTAYASTNQDQSGEYPIKTALSVAIRSLDANGNPQIVGRLGMSVRVNDLGVFKRLSQLSVDACLVEMRDYSWGTGSARGLILDRKREGDSQTFGVPNSRHSAAEQEETEDQVKDAMPRLADSSIAQLQDLNSADAEAILIPDFHDPQINQQQQDAAWAPVRIPYRSELHTGWAVLFIDAAPSESP